MIETNHNSNFGEQGDSHRARHTVQNGANNDNIMGLFFLLYTKKMMHENELLINWVYFLWTILNHENIGLYLTKIAKIPQFLGFFCVYNINSILKRLNDQDLVQK